VQAETLPQANGSVADGSVSADDLIDARKTQRLCPRISAHSRGFMNSVLRISPRWSANTFFDLDLDGPVLNVIHDLYLKQLLAAFSWREVDVLEGAPGPSQPPDRDPRIRYYAVSRAGLLSLAELSS